MRTCAILLVILLAMAGKGISQAPETSVEGSLAKARTDRERVDIYLEAAQETYSTKPLLAIEYAQQACVLAQQHSLDSLFATGQNMQANAHLHLGNYAQALDLYLSLVKYGESKSDSAALVVAYGNIGNVYYYQRDYENALKNDLMSLQYFQRKGDAKQLLRKANLLSNMGSIYDETGRYSEARNYYAQALSIGRSLGNHEVIGNVLNNTGTVFRDEGNDTLALRYYREAYAVRKQNNNVLGMARSSYSLGLYHFQHQQLDSALVYLNQSVELGQQIGSLQTVSSAAEIAYRANKMRGNDKEALDALEIFTRTSDSLFNEQTTKKIAQLEMQFQFDKKQSEMQTAQKQKELYYALGASLLLLFGFGVTVLFLLQKNKTRKAQLKEAELELEKVELKNDLEKKDKELATNVTFLLSKNELINNISEKLLEIKQTIPQESQLSLQKVILDIQSNLQPELWQEFEFRFQQVYENFYKILTVKFPDLSPSERRLCALLKLNMTTKEISALTHQNAKSIDVARTRLRKKLGLTGTDQNLITFLEQLDA